MTMKKTVIAMAALFMISGLALISAPAASADTPADFEPFAIENSVGTRVTFTEPAQKVASLGLSFTTTLMELGCIDKLVMIDNYSAPASSGVSELASIPSYPVSTGEQIGQLLANGDGGFDKNRDVVFIYGYSYHAAAIAAMELLGLKVVTFYPTNYEMGMGMVTSIGAIMGLNEKASGIVSKMQTALTYYQGMLASNSISSPDSKVRAVYVSYSGGTLKVGNVNSYSVTLLKIAGGINPADNDTLTGSALTSYAVDDSMFLQLNIDVIFLDPYYTGTPGEFRTEKNLGSTVKIYKLSMSMNQYGPASLEGMRFMAQAMYPDIFDASEWGQDDTVPENYVLYIAIVSILVSAVAVAYVVFRR
ncbi:MAG: ABC transporter substrate-binding protein [Methanomassiliicoccaceae archaeon]|jgi:ABC-type Fe3+-hydroxamate transport system substrate-binding protein|nr:ABC transporter substrate-binding protein [Methanomassiliicoccaceae archaeon]